MPRHRFVVTLGIVSVTALGLVACSDDLTTPSDTIPVIRLGPDAENRIGAATESGAIGAGDLIATDDGESVGMIAPWWGQIEYRPVGELRVPSTTGTIWRFPEPGEPAPERIAALATAFGVSGELIALGAERGGGWSLGPDDGSEPSVYLAADGPGTWWYQPAWNQIAEPVIIEEGPVTDEGSSSAEGDIAIAPDREVVRPPENVPDAATAQRLARDLWDRLGVDLDRAEIEVWADEWSASVTAWQILDGSRTWQAWNVGFGADAQIIWASGLLRDPEAVGEVDLVDAETALARLRGTAGTWWGGIPAVSAPDIAIDAISEPAPVEPGAVEPGIAVEPDDRIAADPEWVPETVTIDLVGIDTDWWQLTDVDARMWLVPAFAFLDDEGGRHLVPAISDDLIEQAAPSVVPMPEPRPMPEDPAVSEPTSDLPVIGDGAGVDPDFDPGVLVGTDLAEATAIAEKAGFGVRVVSVDGEDFAVTSDYRTDRVNLTLVEDRVTEATIG